MKDYHAVSTSESPILIIIIVIITTIYLLNFLMPPLSTRRAIVLLVGYPGSGKSIFAMLLKNKSSEVGQHWFQWWIQINQDELGTVLEFDITVDNHITHGGCVIVDRCNINTRKKLTWIEMGHNHDALLASNPCISRVMNRPGYPTLNNSLLAEFEALRVICRFQRRQVLLSKYKRIQIFHTVRYGDELGDPEVINEKLLFYSHHHDGAVNGPSFSIL